MTLASDFNSGGQMVQNLRDNIAKNDARAAMISVYGPVAGDPRNALAMQAYGQAQKMNPLLVKQQQTVNAFAAANNPQKLKSWQLSNAAKQQTLNYNDANNPLLLQQRGIANAANWQKVTAGSRLLKAQASAANQKKLYTLSSGLKAELGAGADPQSAWNAVAPGIPGFNTLSPAVRNRLQQSFSANPNAFIARMDAMTTASANGIPSYADRSKAAGAALKGAGMQAKLTATKFANKEAQMKYVKGVRDLYNQKSAAALIASRMARLGDTFQRVRDDVKKLSTSAYVNVALSKLPAQVAKDLMLRMDVFHRNFGLSDIGAMRALDLFKGRVTNLDLSAASESLGAIDPNMTVGQLLKSLNSMAKVVPFVTEYGRTIQDTAAASLKANGLPPTYAQWAATFGAPGDAAAPGATQPSAAPGATQPSFDPSQVVGDTGFTGAQILDQARQAIAAGKDPNAVAGVLKQHGIDPSLLDSGGGSQQAAPEPGGAASQGQLQPRPMSYLPQGADYSPVAKRAAAAIAKIESGGNYAAVGPDTGNGDHAIGAYQVMASNVPAWTKQVLGRAMTPQEFLQDPAAQDAVFVGIFGNYAQKYGNLNDAASAWFSGRPVAQAGNASDGSMTVPSYVSQFQQNFGGA